MNRKILILESNWAENEVDYIKDSRSTTKIYSSIESLLSLHDKPLQIIQRPLLACRFVIDIKQFINLDENKKGINIIIISGHGSLDRKTKNGKKRLSRKLSAIDGDINISIEIRKLSELLSRTIIILDSCTVGTKISSFKKISGALGVIGFSESVDWIDSAVFIFSLLCKYQEQKVFFLQRKSHIKPKQILDKMKSSHYGPFFEELGIEYDFE